MYLREAKIGISGKMLLSALFIAASFFVSPAPASAEDCIRYQDLNAEPLVLESFECEKEVSKGDTDTVTPQIKIVEPRDGRRINYGRLPENENGVKLLPITIVVSPEYIVDFTAATNAVTQYLFVPQEADRGHLHAYCAPEIKVERRRGEITGVEFVGSGNRSDMVGAFCVFREPDPELSTDEYQVLTVDCPLFATEEAIQRGIKYVCKVDATEHSHGPRLKSHPRDVPPGDQVTVRFVNVR